jgi:hypothetical protein
MSVSAAWLIAVGLVCAGAVVVGRSHVPSDAVASTVTRTPQLMERAWHLPVAPTFQRHVDWQSNGSRCGPAAVANAYRSLGEAARTEGEVLAGTWSCWTGVCIMGLTLDELAEVARANTSRKVSVLRDLSENQFLEHLVAPMIRADATSSISIALEFLAQVADIIPQLGAISKPRTPSSCSMSISSSSHG